jgi:cytochrome c553
VGGRAAEKIRIGAPQTLSEFTEDAMRHTALAITAIGFILAGATGTGWSQETAQPAGDIDAGKKVAEICAPCHGAQGMSETPGVPHLSGQHAPYLLKGLEVYTKGERNARTMHNTAELLSEEDKANVAAYYASLKPFSQIRSVRGRQGSHGRLRGLPRRERQCRHPRHAQPGRATCDLFDHRAEILPGRPAKG